MQIFIYTIVSYVLYGVYLILCDFGLSHPDSEQRHNTPMYVFKPSAKNLLVALLIRPFLANGVHQLPPHITQRKILGVVKLMIKVGLMGIILRFIVNLF